MASQADIAHHLDLSVRRVSDTLKKLELPTKGCSLDAARLAYIRHLREVASGRKGEQNNYDLVKERARLAFHQANLAALDEKAREKTLIEYEAVVAEWQRILIGVRNRMLALPSRLASVCGNLPPKDIQREADAIIREALTELANTEPEY